MTVTENVILAIFFNHVRHLGMTVITVTVISFTPVNMYIYNGKVSHMHRRMC